MRWLLYKQLSKFKFPFPCFKQPKVHLSLIWTPLTFMCIAWAANLIRMATSTKKKQNNLVLAINLNSFSSWYYDSLFSHHVWNTQTQRLAQVKWNVSTACFECSQTRGWWRCLPEPRCPSLAWKLSWKEEKIPSKRTDKVNKARVEGTSSNFIRRSWLEILIHKGQYEEWRTTPQLFCSSVCFPHVHSRSIVSLIPPRNRREKKR